MTDTLRKHVATGALFIGAAQSMVWGATGIALVCTGSEFERLLSEFDAELPGATVILLSFTHLIVRFWYLAALLLCLWPLLSLGVVLLLSPRAEVAVSRRIWYFLTWLAPVVFAACVVAGFVVPLMRLISRLSA